MIRKMKLYGWVVVRVTRVSILICLPREHFAVVSIAPSNRWQSGWETIDAKSCLCSSRRNGGTIRFPKSSPTASWRV